MAPAIDKAGVILGGSGRGSVVFSGVGVAPEVEVDETASDIVVDAFVGVMVDVKETELLLLLLLFPPLFPTRADELVTGVLELFEADCC